MPKMPKAGAELEIGLKGKAGTDVISVTLTGPSETVWQTIVHGMPLASLRELATLMDEHVRAAKGKKR